jgi:hypothetical protein
MTLMKHEHQHSLRRLLEYIMDHQSSERIIIPYGDCLNIKVSPNALRASPPGTGTRVLVLVMVLGVQRPEYFAPISF